jgi:2-polyprenyl-6-methoxyphenol hydroxylase-like FAD-dependent oxidoreductase
MESERTKNVLIVGAGPVGLAATLFLSHNGYRPRIIDKLTEPVKTSKALAVNPRTMELLDTIGVIEEFIQNAFQVEAVNLYRNQKCLARNNFNGVKHMFPFIAVQEQAQSEKIFTNILSRKNIFVERGVGLAKISSVGECELQKSDGEIEKVRFDYVFSADGAHSLARKSLGLTFLGDTYNEPWYLYDAKLNTNLKSNEVYIFVLDHEFVFLMRIKDDIWRVFGNNPGLIDHLPKGTFVESIVWQSQYCISHRIIEKFSVGNVFFGGDAAHVHSPVGGRGMNLGIEDAYVFAEFLEKNRLKEYNNLRMDAVIKTVQRIHSMTNLVRGKYFLTRFFRNLLYFLMPFIFPFIRKSMTTFLFGLDHELYI